MLHHKGSVSALEVCRVDKVNCEDFTVSAYFFSSGVTKADVSFCSPYINLDKGMVFMPEEGSLGVAFWSYQNEPIIVAFLNPLTMLSNGKLTRVNPNMGNFTSEPLNEGEFIISSSGRAFIKMDMSGSVLISTPLFNFIRLDDLLNTVFLNSENSQISNESATIFSGVARDTNNELIPTEDTDIYYTENYEKVYDKSDNTINLNIENMPQIPEVLEIQKGNVFDIINNVKTKACSPNADLCYRLTATPNEINLFQGGGEDYAILADDSSSVRDYYKGWYIEILNDVPSGIKGHIRAVTSYNETTKKAYVGENWSLLPTADTAYKIYRNKSVIEIDKLGNLYLGDRGSEYKGVARIGDTVAININGTDYQGTITSGSSTILAGS